jgi:acyl-coenzyme A thioesterase PaaI-like protein
MAHQPRCLVCGPDNPTGLGMHFRLEGDGVVGEVSMGNGQEGAPGFAHGGAVAAVLDDVASTVLMTAEIPAVTVNLDVRYRAPVLLDVDRIRALGRGGQTQTLRTG